MAPTSEPGYGKRIPLQEPSNAKFPTQLPSQREGLEVLLISVAEFKGFREGRDGNGSTENWVLALRCQLLYLMLGQALSVVHGQKPPRMPQIT